MADRKGDRHKKPRLAPLSVEQEDFDKLMAISDKVGLPPAWVHRKLLKEALDDVDMGSLPIVFTKRRPNPKDGLPMKDVR